MDNPYSLTMPQQNASYDDALLYLGQSFKRRIHPYPTEPEYTVRPSLEPREIVTLKGKKMLHFAVTQEGEILISSEQGHIEVFNTQGEYVTLIPLVNYRVLRMHKDNPAVALPPGADMLCSDINDDD